MRHNKAFRGLALLLTLVLALAPAASALTVEEARALLKENYIDPIPEEVLNLPTIDEITAALGDPYTYFMTPEQYSAFRSDLTDAEVVGIGVMVEMQVGGLQVTKVAPDSPAALAGIQAGDLIDSAAGVTLAEAGSPEALSKLITGEAGTDVTVGYQRGGQPLSATMTRALVIFPLVTGALTDGHVGWIACSSFGDETGTELQNYIQEFDAAADRWVMDLRGNPGGLASAVIEAVSFSAGNSTVAYVVDQDLNVRPWQLSPFAIEVEPLLTEPMIVLLDGVSASASELYAAAMRDYGTALLVGERSFGKGIGQDLLEQEDGSALRVTSFRYYSPQWVTPDKSGVLPNLVVEAGMADRVAMLLSGKEENTTQALTVNLIGWDWYVHKAAAMADQEAFTALLSALPADAPLTLNGEATNAAAVAKAWGAPYESRTFSDTADSPYRQAIDHMAVLGLLQGSGDGQFTPGDTLTRSQLCALLAGAMGYWNWNNERTLPFTDVGADAWYYTAVKIMYELGLVSGVNDTAFDPEGTVTHAQFLTILGRMGTMADLTIRQRTDEMTDQDLSDPDVAKFAPWAQSAAAVAKLLDYTCKPLAELDPTAPILREEAAATLYNLMRYMTIITLTENYAEAPVNAAA